MPYGMTIAEFIQIAHRLLDLLRQLRPLTKPEEYVIDSLLLTLRMEWEYYKSQQEDPSKFNSAAAQAHDKFK